MFNTFINIGNYKWIIFLTFPLYEVSSPNMVINLLCRSFDNALVSTLATMSFVEQYSNVTSSFLTRSQTKWSCTLMCFVRACWVGFFVNDIAPWLSHRIAIAFFSFIYHNSFMSFVIHMASLIAYVLAMYSALVVDKTILGCRLLLQEMAPPPIMNTNLVVDLLSSRSSVQSASQYPTKSWGGNPPKRNLNSKVPCKYWKMCLTTMQCSRLGFAMCWLTTLIGNAKSSRIHNMAYIKGPTTYWYETFTISSSLFTFFFNFGLGSSSIAMALQSSMPKRLRISLRYPIWLM